VKKETKPPHAVGSDNFVGIAASSPAQGNSVTVKDGHSKIVAKPKGLQPKRACDGVCPPLK